MSKRSFWHAAKQGLGDHGVGSRLVVWDVKITDNEGESERGKELPDIGKRPVAI